MSLVCLILAIAIALWASFAQADYITYGNYFFLIGLSLAFGWASMLPWARRP